MDILLSKEVFQKYFDNLNNHSKDESLTDLFALINNHNNRFVICKILIEHLEKRNEGSSYAQVFLLPFLTNIINNQSINIKPQASSGEDLTEDLKNGYKLNSSITKKDIFLVVALKADTTSTENNYIILDEVNKPNKNWIFLKLAGSHPNSISLRWYDFNSNNLVIKTFKEILSVISSGSQVDIFDKQVNLDHAFFDAFNQNNLVHYYTLFGAYRGNSDSLYSKFKRVKIFTTGNRNHIHERRILVNNLIIEVDDDFWNLQPQRNTWKIDVTYCPHVSNKINEKKGSFVYRIR
ncbi:hypothetical protein [Pedobacter metabolipauper]|uniref:Uncharacterized protein n=1 Tax=Pedobacter metabolipauper TaxID=425513 RepID=A0A4R6SPZ9_9SPHI|nr:hypothetical protein [Pedobacter metabolipauper]TDQ06239.1 hypothetical protein ATK78_4620 [Pedobacter metabolipauper]